VRKIFSICIIMVLSGSFAFSGGLFVTPGTRAGAMGGAYTGIADDATAIYWNPAGLVQINGSGVELDIIYVKRNATSNTSLMNVNTPDEKDGDFPLPKVYPTEPNEYNSKKFTTNSFLPFIAGYSKINDISLAGGFYAIGGGGGNWNDTVKGGVDDVSVSVDGALGFIIGNISAAKKIVSKVYVGIGLNYIYSIDNTEVEKQYTRATGSSMPSDYSVAIEKSGTGNGIQMVLGTMYIPIDKLRMGFVYKNGTTVNISGKSEYTLTGLASLGLPDVNNETNYSQNYAYPATYSFGASYDPINPLTIAFSIIVNKYSVLKNDVDYKNETVFKDVNTSLNYSDTTQVMIGGEYRMAKISLRGGFQIDPGPAPSDKRTLLDTKMYSHKVIYLGFGYKLKMLRTDFSYGYSMSNKPNKNEREYKYSGGGYRLTVGYEY